MSLTESTKLAAIRMRAERISTIDIAETLGASRQDITRFFMACDYKRTDASRLSRDEPGLADAIAELNREDAMTKAAEMWHTRMRGLSWRVQRREGQG